MLVWAQSAIGAPVTRWLLAAQVSEGRGPQMIDHHRYSGMSRHQARRGGELVWVELQVEPEPILRQRLVPLPPRRTLQQVAEVTVARPRGLVVEDLTDAADPIVRSQPLQQRRHRVLLQRRGCHHDRGEPPSAELARDPLRFGGTGAGKGFSSDANVLGAHHLDERTARKLEAVAGDITLVAGEGVSSVVHSRRHIPDMKVRVPKLHRGVSIAEWGARGPRAARWAQSQR